ncbi:MAG: O-antigen ligase family protein [Acidobacteria bacterium]|nr:O-antigen ligase family protein [Acidobacteriota bacterium]
MHHKTRIEPWLDGIALLLVMLVTPFLLFPNMKVICVAILIPCMWLCNYWVKGHFVKPTPLNMLLLSLIFMVLTSCRATFDAQFSLPKVAGVLLGVFVFFSLVQFIESESKLKAVIGFYCLGGLALALFSLVGTQWQAKLPTLGRLVRFFPTRFKGLPGAEEGFRPNAVGGSMILFIPLLFLLSSYVLQNWSKVKKRFRVLLIISLISSFFLFTWILLLSQSRGAWVGLAVAAGLLLAQNLRWFRWLASGLVGVCFLLATILSPWQSPEPILQDRFANSELSLSARFGVWERAIYGIQDFPFTGMGMNIFRKVMPVLYPAPNLPPDVDVASAHNHILQAALDLGLPGMVAYLAIWAATARLIYYVWKESQNPLDKVLAQGLGTGLLAQFIFQMTDAIPLGAKAGLFFWMALALSVALFERVRKGTTKLEVMVTTRSKVTSLEVFVMWGLFSLLAIGFMGEHPYAGLSVGTVGGIFLGYGAFENFLGAQRDELNSGI